MKFSDLRIDSSRIKAGVWISPGEEYGSLELKVRSFGDAYTNMRAAKTRQAALRYGRDESRIPVEISRQILIDCLAEHVLIDVRGVENDSGSPATVEDWVSLMRHPDGTEAVTATIKAAGIAGTLRAEDKKDAVGN